MQQVKETQKNMQIATREIKSCMEKKLFYFNGKYEEGEKLQKKESKLVFHKLQQEWVLFLVQKMP